MGQAKRRGPIEVRIAEAQKKMEEFRAESLRKALEEQEARRQWAIDNPKEARKQAEVRGTLAALLAMSEVYNYTPPRLR